MKKEMRDTMENRKGQKPNRRGGLAGKLAVTLTVLLIAGGGFCTWRQATSNVPELTTFVDHEGETVIIDSDGQEVPLKPGEPKVTKDTQTSRKTVTMKKPAKRTYTRKSTKTKNSSDEKENGSNVVVTNTTVVTVKKKKFKKNSRKKVVITKVTTTKEISIKGAETLQADEAAQEEQGARTADISTLAPKLNSAVMGAYTSLGFTVTIDPSVSYSGYFNARNQSIILKKEGDTVYHEMGHFLAFVAGNVDKKAEFTAVYNEEKGKYTGTNKSYVTQNSSEYFAESFKDYTLDPVALQSSRPKTYQAIVSALGNVTAQQLSKLKLAYGSIWK